MKTKDLKAGVLAYWFARSMGGKDSVRMEGPECLMRYDQQDFNGITIVYHPYKPYQDSHEMFGVMSMNDIYVNPLGKYAGLGFGTGPRAYEASAGTVRYLGPTLGEAICKVMIHKAFGEEVPEM
jgi:hypothetical protein